MPRERERDQRQPDSEPRKVVVVSPAGRPQRVQVVDVIAAEPEPGEKSDEANHQPKGAPAVGFLLLKKGEGRLVRHALGFVERADRGTARSAPASRSPQAAGSG